MARNVAVSSAENLVDDETGLVPWKAGSSALWACSCSIRVLFQHIAVLASQISYSSAQPRTEAWFRLFIQNVLFPTGQG